MIAPLLASLALAQAPDGMPPWEPPVLVPPALMAQPRFAPFVLPDELRVVPTEPGLAATAEVLRGHLAQLTGREVTVGEAPAREGDVVLTLGYLMDAAAGSDEGYAIEVFADHVALSGASPTGVCRAASRCLQLLEQDPESGAWTMPAVRVDDAPAHGWRGLMLDLARFPHPVEAVEEAIELAYLAGLNRVQLHLTDDQAFTFPASCLPPRTDPARGGADRGYTLEDIARLVAFADARGIVLVPEIDVPAHASSLVRARPDLFGTKDAETGEWRSTGVIHMASAAAQEAVDALLGEVAAAFPTSPWIHLGGDEVWAPHLVETAEFPAYAEAHGIPARVEDGAVQELLSHFLARRVARVRELGREPILWEGFRPAKLEANRVPGDVTVMSWNMRSAKPADLLAAGHPIINCNWEPLYVVPAQDWASQPSRAWDWTPRDLRQRYGGEEVTLPDDANLLGAQICVWEQRPDAIVPSVLRLLPELSTRMWGTGEGVELGASTPASRRARQLFARLLRPVEVRADGLAGPAGTLFEDAVRLTPVPSAAGRVMVDVGPADALWRPGRPDARPWDGEPIELRESALVTAWLEDDEGRPVGHPTRVRFQRGTPVLRFSAHGLPEGGAVDGAVLDATWADGDSRIGAGVLAAPDRDRMTAINRELFARVRDRLPLRSHVDLRPLCFTAVAPGRRIDPLRPRLWGRYAVYAQGQLRVEEGGTWAVTGSARSGWMRLRIGEREVIAARDEERTAALPMGPGVYAVTVEHAMPFVHADVQLTFQREGADGPLALYDLLLPLSEHVDRDELVVLPR